MDIGPNALEAVKYVMSGLVFIALLWVFFGGKT
jgi:hypothetical protein